MSCEVRMPRPLLPNSCAFSFRSTYAYPKCCLTARRCQTFSCLIIRADVGKNNLEVSTDYWFETAAENVPYFEEKSERKITNNFFNSYVKLLFVIDCLTRTHSLHMFV